MSYNTSLQNKWDSRFQLSVCLLSVYLLHDSTASSILPVDSEDVFMTFVQLEFSHYKLYDIQAI